MPSVSNRYIIKDETGKFFAGVLQSKQMCCEPLIQVLSERHLLPIQATPKTFILVDLGGDHNLMHRVLSYSQNILFDCRVYCVTEVA